MGTTSAESSHCLEIWEPIVFSKPGGRMQRKFNLAEEHEKSAVDCCEEN